jgi:molecular chaperone DnaK
MSRYVNFGIDLGTTNSCVASAADGEVRIIPNNDQMSVTPSAVRVLRSGALVVGRRAADAVTDDPENVAQEFKRVMGQRYEKRFPASGRVMTPEELSAEVLKSLLADVRRRTGSSPQAAVITVPAAFTALQCEATARAARLAGLVLYPLLQEPVAAAVAYGAAPGAGDQRWLVFDLGGGTLDVAVVSTREGRLQVLEHRGDNHLGGKDVDRLVVERLLLPQLAELFALPAPASDPAGYNRLIRRLTAAAEYAKIELTTAAETTLSLYDFGADAEGREIEAELKLSRAEIEREAAPVIARCLRLVDEALAGARLAGADLDRVLLVGGPTQMPSVRTALAEHLGARVDASLDPVTVVARGAALYASTIELDDSMAKQGEGASATGGASAQTDAGAGGKKSADVRLVTSEARPEDEGEAATIAAAGTLKARLAFDPVSSAAEARVAGVLTGGRPDARLEVKIDAGDGGWTSGWQEAAAGFFETRLVLREGLLNSFMLSVRDERGRLLAVEPQEFQVRHGLTISAPPLPHTISVEIVHADGRVELSPIFPRRTLLPAERTVTYRAAHALRPSEPDTSLAVKLWEGETLSDPQANIWVGNLHVRAEQVRRPVPEGAEIQLHLKIDASRLITVEVLIPQINQHFAERVFIPQEEESDYLEALKRVRREVEATLVRLARLEVRLTALAVGSEEEDEFPEMLYEDGSASLDGVAAEAAATEGRHGEVRRLRREVEDLDMEAGAYVPTGEMADHDYARGLVERLRVVRARVAELEGRAGIGAKATSAAAEADELVVGIEADVLGHGTEAQRERFQTLYGELRAARGRHDERGVRKAVAALRTLRGQVLYAQDWFWEQWFDYLSGPAQQFINRDEADKWLAQGREAAARRDRAQLEQAVRRLWPLMPPDVQVEETERAVRPGLKQ